MIVLGGVCPGECKVLFGLVHIYLVVRLTLPREGERGGKRGTVAA